MFVDALISTQIKVKLLQTLTDCKGLNGQLYTIDHFQTSFIIVINDFGPIYFVALVVPEEFIQ